MFCKVNSLRFWVCSSVAYLLYYSLGSAARRRTAAGLAALGLIMAGWFRFSAAGG